VAWRQGGRALCGAHMLARTGAARASVPRLLLDRAARSLSVRKQAMLSSGVSASGKMKSSVAHPRFADSVEQKSASSCRGAGCRFAGCEPLCRPSGSICCGAQAAGRISLLELLRDHRPRPPEPPCFAAANGSSAGGGGGGGGGGSGSGCSAPELSSGTPAGPGAPGSADCRGAPPAAEGQGAGPGPACASSSAASGPAPCGDPDGLAALQTAGSGLGAGGPGTGFRADGGDGKAGNPAASPAGGLAAVEALEREIREFGREVAAAAAAGALGEDAPEPAEPLAGADNRQEEQVRGCASPACSAAVVASSQAVSSAGVLKGN